MKARMNGRHVFKRLFFLVGLVASPAWANPSTVLSVKDGDTVHKFSVEELLHRPETQRLDLSHIKQPLGPDVPAIPLSALIHQDDALAFQATDLFTAEIPRSVFEQARKHHVTAWIAIEDKEWPKRRPHGHDLGPFALVWTGEEVGIIKQEQWVDQLAAITPSSSNELPSGTSEPAAKGQVIFAENCLPCHQLMGVGEGSMGPDLGRPIPVTEYITPKGFRAIIRNPKQVRKWPSEHMESFPESAISESDLDALWTYLQEVGQSGLAQKHL
ncbi:cytochrome c [Gluconobacter cerinus]|uniref:c-type cytochrome n=2 Tax=Gluconobacter TaxID=441 RepID=UPI00192381EF|nr:cytochrome c [Gluconobacter cerinus]MCW2265024.1 mono/diheme cytochrome c family protein [Gluconobacter cerinus]